MLGWNESAWFSLWLGVALKSAAVLSAAWLAAFVLRGRSAAARHLVWTAAAAAVLALPLLSLALPAVRVPVGNALPRLGVLFRTTVTASPGGEAPQDAAPASAAAAVRPGTALPDWRLALMLVWAAGAAAFRHRDPVHGRPVGKNDNHWPIVQPCPGFCPYYF